jgi:hypothetical protein
MVLSVGRISEYTIIETLNSMFNMKYLSALF